MITKFNLFENNEIEKIFEYIIYQPFDEKKFNEKLKNYDVNDIIDGSENLIFGLMSKYHDDSEIKIKYLIEKGIDLNYQEKSFGNTVLFDSCNSNRKYLSNLFIDNGIDVNIQNNNGEVALVRSLRFSTCKIIDKLIELTDWSIIDNKGFDVFSYIELYKNKTYIKKYPEKYRKYLKEKKREKFNL